MKKQHRDFKNKAKFDLRQAPVACHAHQFLYSALEMLVDLCNELLLKAHELV